MTAEESRRTEAGAASIYDAAAFVLRNARLMLGVLVLVLATTLTGLLLLGRTYTAQSTVTPEASDAHALPLAGIAAQFGIALPSGSGGESPDFYSRLLRSRQLLEAAGLSEYRFEVDGDGSAVKQGTLLELYEVSGETERDRVQKLVDRLEDDVIVTIDARAGVLAISTTAPWRQLAELLNRRLLDLVSEFNLETRQTRAAAERRFVEERLGEARTELRSAEAELRAFREQNRRLGASPELELEHERLGREVALRQQVYTSLAQAHEQARIDEVRNTPVITVVDPPEGSARPTRGLVPTVLLGLMVGSVAGLSAALLREGLRGMRRRNPERHTELRRLAGRVLRGGGAGEAPAAESPEPRRPAAREPADAGT